MNEICRTFERIGLTMGILLFAIAIVLCKVFIRVGWIFALVIIIFNPQIGLLMVAVWCMMFLAMGSWLC